jgi:RNase H-fold protein (predicted Holliday junction resolvase)
VRVLGIDPGSTKCGIAVVERNSETHVILHRDVLPTEELPAKLKQLDSEFTPQLVVIGDGTRSKPIQDQVRKTLPGKSLMIVDERDTSIRARERYWEETPRRGWRRVWPSTLQVPPVPIDDFVAVILAERVLSAGD